MANETLRRLAADLTTYGIDYNVIGAMALNQHGYRRFTEDIDLLMTPAGLTKFQTKKFHQTEQNVSIRVIVSGEFPGDGKPNSVRFPDPSAHFVIIDGIKTVDLPHLIELKLASGMSGLARLKDLADVQELIRVRGLDDALAANLDPFVRDKYLELYEETKQARIQDLSEPG